VAETTGIGWCDATFNPWIGCEKVSPGCARCYALELVTGRMNRPGTWGADGVRERTADSTWKKPLRWQRLADQGLLPDGKTPSRGRRPRVFCASLADVFEPRPELEPWRHDLFGLIEQTPSLDWLLLTKRPDEARDWLRWYYADGATGSLLFGREWTSRDHIGWGVLPNVWIGTSIENSRFTWRADVLREIPAAVRFISAEPLLGSLFLNDKTLPVGELDKAMEIVRSGSVDWHPELKETLADAALDWRRKIKKPLDLTGIDWLIVGGESGGRDARPMHPDWARELRDACLDLGKHDLDAAFATGAPNDVISEGITDEMIGRDRPAFFFKQWGSWVYDPDTLLNVRYAGASPTSGGKILDGREWAEFPAVPAAVAA
jgi:protein gp37